MLEGTLADRIVLEGLRGEESIAIANSDAGARANFDTAVDQTHRAIEELGSAWGS